MCSDDKILGMKRMKLLIIFGVALLTQCGRPHNIQDCKATETESETSTEEGSCFRSYEIGKDEVRDTSFTLPRKLLDDPMAFMKALTDVQMINRKWTDTYNYPVKLLFGDSILRKICKEVAASDRKPFFLIEKMQDFGDYFFYILDAKKGGVRTYTSYWLEESGVKEGDGKMTEFYRDLLDEWNKEEMFMFGETDEPKRVETHTGRIIDTGEVTSKYSGGITRLRCDKDSVYVDMVKLYLWTLGYILDEAEETERMNRYLMKKRKKQLEQSGLSN